MTPARPSTGAWMLYGLGTENADLPGYVVLWPGRLASGARGGMTHGATDEFGFRTVENKVHIHDLHATILHLLGLDHERLTLPLRRPRLPADGCRGRSRAADSAISVASIQGTAHAVSGREAALAKAHS